MKLIMEFGDDELLHPQMVAAIAAQLESQVNDAGVQEEMKGALDTLAGIEDKLKKATGGNIEKFPTQETVEESAPVEDPNQMELIEEGEVTAVPTIDELRALCLTYATQEKTAKAVMDLIEGVCGKGNRQLMKVDESYHTAIGEALREAINE